MNHSSLYKTSFSINTNRRLNETKITRQQRRNECFQQGRLIAVSPTPNEIKHALHKEDNENKSAKFLTIPVSPKLDKENVQNGNNTFDEMIKIKIPDPNKKNDSIKSKIERQQLFLSKFSEWKRQKEIAKLRQRKTTKVKPFVSACFKNPVFGEYINTIKPAETKNKHGTTEFQFQMKKYVLLATKEPAASNLLADKKPLKTSDNTCRKKCTLREAATKSNNVIIKKPIQTMNNNKTVKSKTTIKQVIEPTMHRYKKTSMQSPAALVKSKNIRHPVIKKEIKYALVNPKKKNLFDEPGDNQTNLFKKPLEIKTNEMKSPHTLKRPPLFLKSNRKIAPTINANSSNSYDAIDLTNSIFEISDFVAKKSVPVDFVTSTLRKNEGKDLSSVLHLEESEIKPSSSIKNSSMENDFKPILSSSDENSPLVDKKEENLNDFYLNKRKTNNEIISESNNKITPSRRISERLSTRKRLTCCSGDFLIDNFNPTPAQDFFNRKTPTQSNNPENQNYYMSPQVAVSRGKVSARKEREKRDSIYLTDIDSPRKSILKRTKETICYFRSQLKDEEARLLKLCSDWLDYLNTLSSSVIIDIAGPMVNAAIGVTNLLISKKMKKFNCLIERCEETVTTNKFDNVNVADLDDSLKPVEIQDLDGFWCIIRQQIEDLEKRFNNLIRWRDNNWNDPDFLQPIKMKERTKNNIIKKKKTIKTETSGNIKLKEAIKRMRAERLKELENKDVSLKWENEILQAILPPQRKSHKSSIKDETIKQVTYNNTINDTPRRRSGRISQIINNIRRNSTPRSSRKSARKSDRNTPEIGNEHWNLISFTKTPEHSVPRKSILKTPGTARKMHNVIFHEQIAEFKSPEFQTPEGRLSLGKTRGCTRRKKVSNKN